MDRFELVQKLLSLGASYEVFGAGGGGALYTVKGSVLRAKAKLELCEGSGGKVLATLRGNVLRTKFEVVDANGRTLAKLSFPLLALRKQFKLTAEGVALSAAGGLLSGDFAGKTKNGELVLSIKKKASLRDKLAIETSGALPREVAVLAAVAVDQKFYAE